MEYIIGRSSPESIGRCFRHKIMTTGVLVLTVAVGLSQQSVMFRAAAPPTARFEYRTWVTVDEGDRGHLDVFFLTAHRVLTNTKATYTARTFIAAVQASASGTLTSSVQSLTSLRSTQFDSKRNSRNQLISATREGKAYTNRYFEGITCIDFPQSPMAVGLEWSQPQFIDSRPVLMHFQLESLGSAGMGRTAIIKAVIAEEQGIVSLEPFTYIVDVSTGILRKAMGRYQMISAGQTTEVSFKTERASYFVPPPPVIHPRDTGREIGAVDPKPKPKVQPRKKRKPIKRNRP